MKSVSSTACPNVEVVRIQYEVGSDLCPVDNVEDSDLCPVDNVEDAIEYDRRFTTCEETGTTENENDTLRFSIYEKPHGVPNKAKIQKSIRFHHHSLGARYQPFDRGRYSVSCCPTMDFQSSPHAIFQASRLAFATLTVLRMVRGSIVAIQVYCRFYCSIAFQCVVQGWIFRTEASRKRLDAAFVLQFYCRRFLVKMQVLRTHAAAEKSIQAQYEGYLVLLHSQCDLVDIIIIKSSVVQRWKACQSTNHIRDEWRELAVTKIQEAWRCFEAYSHCTFLIADNLVAQCHVYAHNQDQLAKASLHALGNTVSTWILSARTSWEIDTTSELLKDPFYFWLDNYPTTYAEFVAIDIITGCDRDCPPSYLVVDTNWHQINQFGCFEPGGVGLVESNECRAIDFFIPDKCRGAEQPPNDLHNCLKQEMLDLALDTGNRVGFSVRVNTVIAGGNNIFVHEYSIAILIQLMIRRSLSFKRIIQHEKLVGLLVGPSSECLHEHPATRRIQPFWNKTSLKMRKRELHAAVVIHRCFAMVKFAIDREMEISCQQDKMLKKKGVKSQRTTRGTSQSKTCDQHALKDTRLEGAWSHTVERDQQYGMAHRSSNPRLLCIVDTCSGQSCSIPCLTSQQSGGRARPNPHFAGNAVNVHTFEKVHAVTGLLTVFDKTATRANALSQNSLATPVGKTIHEVPTAAAMICHWSGCHSSNGQGSTSPTSHLRIR